MYNAQLMQAQNSTCVLAVDWGSKRLGIAVSDPTRKIARPLGVFLHTSRVDDAEKIVELSRENHADVIIIGVTYDDENRLSPSGRSASRLADEISKLFGKPVILWDESFTTQAAKELQIEKGISQKKRRGHQDDIAAELLLKDYLEKINS